MDVDANRTRASLFALQFLVGELISALPKERQDVMYAAAKARFAPTQKNFAEEAMLVVNMAFGRDSDTD